jgi:peptide-methionine (R)-S-oxide reductase
MVRYRASADPSSPLTPRQYGFTHARSVEPPFNHGFWDLQDAGIYVEFVFGEPLSAFTKRYDSGRGGPCLTGPLVPENQGEYGDVSFGMMRSEVRSMSDDRRLGYVFTDDQAEAGGLRYCTNSAALRFVAYEDLEIEGDGQYRGVVEDKLTSEGMPQ